MVRPFMQNRHSVVDATLTLRLTQQDRELLQELVALKAAELIDTGMEATAASYVRGLIRHEARTKGLVSSDRQQNQSTLRQNESTTQKVAGERPRGSARRVR